VTAALAGIVEDMPENEYHAHPALSSTGARKLLETPATFKHYLDTPEKPKSEFDLGTLVHARVLGVGAQAAVYPDDVLASNGAASTTAAKTWAAEQRAAGLIPVKADVAAEVTAMTEAVLAHREARRLLEQDGQRESSLFANDPETGVEIRARFDLYADECADLKTARDASPKGFTRAVFDHRYDVQQEHYLKTRELVTGDRPPFRFIVVESAAPFLVGVYALNEQWQEIGDVWAAHARRLYQMCSKEDIWPGYGNEIHELIPPMGLIYEHQERFENAGMMVI
jgi:hypothetical protein